MSEKSAFTGATVFDGWQLRADAALVIQGGRVTNVVGEDELPEDIARTHMDGGVIAPGLVDLQVNGGGGVMLNDSPDTETIRKIADAHCRAGTTSILPTLISDDRETTLAAMNAARKALVEDIPGALGLHLEGPHLSSVRKGAHDAAAIRPMDDEDCRTLCSLAGEIPSLLLTVAPEAASLDQIARLAGTGAIVSLGHTDCGLETAVAAVEAGATCVTHLFNAMSQLGSREPGLVGAALESGNLNVGLIADGFHVDPASVRIAVRAKRGPGRIFLVSDSMLPMGTGMTEFTLNGRRVLRQNGRLTLADGTLAGADTDLASSVRFMIDVVGLGKEEALRMATLNPAVVLGREKEIGCLAPGSRADFICLDDDFRVKRTWRGGTVVAGSWGETGQLSSRDLSPPWHSRDETGLS